MMWIYRVVKKLPLSNMDAREVTMHYKRKGDRVEEALANDIIEFEGKQYKKVDREAREGDVVVFNDVGGSHYFETNKPYKVQEDTYVNGVGKHSGYKEAHPVYVEEYNRTSETVDVYELIVEDIPFFVPKPAKTTNQLRAEIIEKAKGFLETSKSEWEGLVMEGSEKGQRKKFSGVYQVFIKQLNALRKHVAACNVDFVINEEKRTIVALMRGLENNKVYARGIAKCMPGDVFNTHIGKAIALGRALGLDVSEFEQAVQPTHATGQVCKIQNWHGHNGNLTTLKNSNESGFYHTYYGGWLSRGDLKIVNDTKAQYSSEVNE